MAICIYSSVGIPSLTIGDLKQLIANIKQQVFIRLVATLLLMKAAFIAELSNGLDMGSNAWYYQAPILRLFLNENMVPITLTASKILGEKTEVTLASNEKPLIKINSDVATVTQAESETNCQIEVQMDESNQLNLKGCGRNCQNLLP